MMNEHADQIDLMFQQHQPGRIDSGQDYQVNIILFFLSVNSAWIIRFLQYI